MTYFLDLEKQPSWQCVWEGKALGWALLGLRLGHTLSKVIEFNRMWPMMVFSTFNLKFF